ncbi:MAG: N-6 DNA methylase, partial [Byssovorax sp.]
MRSNLATLRSSFARVGYTPELLEEGHVNEAGARIPWCVGYALLPRTARNACVAAIEAASPATVEQVLKLTGAPVALVLDGAEVTVLQQGVGGVTKADVVPVQEFADLTDRARTFIDPRSIHRAKTLGRFDASYQLTFVDVGLLPQIERTQGEDLGRLLERIVAALRLPADKLTNEQRHQVLTIAFWILAARMLRDHGVPDFVKLNADGRSVLQAIARHYGGAVPILAAHKKWQPRIEAATALAWQFGGNLGKIGPEAIAYVNESSLIAEQTRRDLGTHSTPPFIVEYVLGRLREAILAIPVGRRLVVEPACGHAAFLVAALRVLAEDVPADATRHDYLRDHLRGLEIDHAAKELARLSLTVADVPNSDGWDLRESDMFEGDALANLGQGGTILLANPPFENFDEEERARLSEASGEPVLSNKASEMLRRVLPALAPDAVIGVVMPRSFLSSEGDRALRSLILASFELIEICVFPDQVFRFSDHECVVILARGAPGGTKRDTPVAFRRVREAGMAGFRECARVSAEEMVPGSIFLDRPEADLALPELRRIWSARGWSTLIDIAFVQQGLSYHGWVRQSGHETVRDHAF